MNSDTATTQWGQDEEVLLIEPDRGEDSQSSERLREESHMTEGGGEEGRTVTCVGSLLYLVTINCACLTVEVSRGKEGCDQNSDVHK